MDENTLYRAIKLKKDLDQAYLLRNKAYNSHMYLQVELDGESIRECKPEIGKILYDFFSAKADAIQKELDEL